MERRRGNLSAIITALQPMLEADALRWGHQLILTVNVRLSPAATMNEAGDDV